MSRKLLVSITLLIFGVFGACEENGNPNLIAFYWEQTGCSDPWAVNSSSSQKTLKSAVEAYLKEEGIVGARFTSIETEWSGAVCLACHCKTGQWIYVSAPFHQKEKMLELGFLESN